MYHRNIDSPPEHLVENGRPVFGTYGSAPKRLDIRNVVRPFGVLPMPPFVTNLRIRSQLSFTFTAGKYIGTISFLDAKAFGYAEIVVWDMASGQKYAYSAVFGPRRRSVPHSLENGLCFVSARGRYIRIAWNRKRQSLSAVFILAGDSVRPAVTGSFSAPLSGDSFGEGCAVLPAPVMRRCRAVYWAAVPLEGTIAVGRGVLENLPVNGRALFSISRAYCKLRTDTDMVYGAGMCGNMPVSFSIVQTSLEAVNPDMYNENVLFSGNEMTALPPVRITRPYGINGKWIIQDTENMVDLIFTPYSDNLRSLNIFILSTTSHVVYGKFEGVLLRKDGSPVELKDFAGAAKKQNLRL